MVDFDPDQQEMIKGAFNALRDADCRFVIPRGYRGLPDSVPGSDIELLVAPDDFERGMALVTEYGFSSPRTGPSSYLQLVDRALDRPGRTIRRVLGNPRWALSMVGSVNSDPNRTSSLRNQFVEPTLTADGVVLHFHNHLAYTSPMYDTKVRVEPSVEHGMLSRRRIRGNFPIPSPPDELAHLVARGVFDYEGDFPDYYVDTCNELWDGIEGDEEETAILKELLSDLFFKASYLVYQHINRGDYGSIREALCRFDDY